MVDWNAIKTEYITTNTSYRKLSDKYNVSFNTLQCRAKREGWVELQRHHQEEIETKTIKNAVNKASEYKSTLYDLAYDIAIQLKTMTQGKTIEDLAKAGLKPRDITGAIKDIEDILHIKSEADMREQEVRIKNLQKQVDDDNENREITVHIQGSANEYSK